MKRSIILALVLMTTLFSGGCGQDETKPPNDKSGKNETIQQSVDSVDNVDETNDIEDTTEDVSEEIITIYYFAGDSEDIITKDISVTGDISEGIIQELKNKKVLSDECKVQEVLVDQNLNQIHIDIDKEFGDYFRSMGTTGSELILKCLVQSYQATYKCESVLITEDGKPLDTGHAVLDGYISYE